MLLDTEMANKMHLTSQVTAMALLPGAKPVLSDDLKRLRLVLLVDMTQAMQSALLNLKMLHYQ